MKTVGILMLGDLCDFPQDQIATVGKMPEKSLTAFKKLACKQVKQEDRAKYTNYCKCPNLYKAKFGTTWEDNFKESSRMDASIVIADFVEHMMEEIAASYQGTIHTDTWMTFHGALSLMRAKDCTK